MGVSQHQEHRFFVDSVEKNLPAKVRLSAEDSHHARNVLRLQTSDPVSIVDLQTGGVFHGTIATLSDLVTVTLNERITEQKNDLAVVNTLIFGLSKGKRNDLVCEKITELGVENIVLWQSSRSIVKISTDQEETRLERWRKISHGAAKQSQKSFLPEISLVRSFSELVTQLDTLATGDTRRLCGSLLDSATPLPHIPPVSGPIQMIIGPEGDLSPEEQDNLSQVGFELVSFGEFTLRSETAAIVAVAMAQALWGFRG